MTFKEIYENILLGSALVGFGTIIYHILGRSAELAYLITLIIFDIGSIVYTLLKRKTKKENKSNKRRS